MTKIKKYIEKIDDELCDAKKYAESYVEYKSKGNMAWANKYKDMSNQELQHAMNLHDMAMSEIEEINKVFKPTEAMQEKWDKSHTEYVEKVAWIRQMLAM